MRQHLQYLATNDLGPCALLRGVLDCSGVPYLTRQDLRRSFGHKQLIGTGR